MKYWIAWIYTFSLKFEVCLSRFCLTVLFIGLVVNRAEKRYCIWFAFPKYSLIITNEKKYPYVSEVWYWKIGHFHLCHVMGSKLKEIPRKVDLSNA